MSFDLRHIMFTMRLFIVQDPVVHSKAGGSAGFLPFRVSGNFYVAPETMVLDVHCPQQTCLLHQKFLLPHGILPNRKLMLVEFPSTAPQVLAALLTLGNSVSFNSISRHHTFQETPCQIHLPHRDPDRSF